MMKSNSIDLKKFCAYLRHYPYYTREVKVGIIPDKTLASHLRTRINIYNCSNKQFSYININDAEEMIILLRSSIKNS